MRLTWHHLHSHYIIIKPLPSRNNTLSTNFVCCLLISSGIVQKINIFHYLSVTAICTKFLIIRNSTNTFSEIDRNFDDLCLKVQNHKSVGAAAKSFC